MRPLLPRLCLLAALAAALPGPLRAAPEDAATWLGRLSSPSLSDRQLAQRWLAAHLGARDYEALAAAARGGDLELVHRLATALATDDRHLDLAVRLACERDEPARRTGELAVRELAARWGPASAEEHEPLRDLLALRRLAKRTALSYELRSSGDEPLAAAVDRVARLAAPIPIVVVDPDLDPRTWTPAERPAQGPDLFDTPDRLLYHLARRYRVSFEAYGFGDGTDERQPMATGAWIRFCLSGDEKRGLAADHLLEWLRDVERRPTPERAAACARALGAVGWPAALGYLEERYRDGSDRAALEGLAVAAGRGLLQPVLASPDVQRDLLRRADAAAAAGEGWRASLFARALAAAGSGGPLPTCDGLVEGWAGLGARQRWVRLVALEGQRCGGAPLAPVRDLLADRATPPALAFQALRTLAACAPRTAVPVFDAAALLRYALAEQYTQQLLELAHQLALDPPAEWADPARLPGGWGLAERRLALGWWLARERWDVAGAHLAALLPRSDLETFEEVERLLRELARSRGAAAVRSVLDARPQDAGFESFYLDLQLACDAAPPELESRELEQLLGRASGGDALRPAELRRLGRLAGGPEGAEARTALVALMRDARDKDVRRDVAAGLVEAVERLRRRREYVEERRLVEAVEDAAPSPFVARWMGAPSWPPTELPAPRRLRALDRALPPEL